MPISIREGVARLRAFQARISQPTDFYASHAALWLDMAQRLAKSAVIHARPPDELPELWAAKAETLASKITYRLHELPECGITLSLSDAPPGDPAQAGSLATASNDINVSDLMRFVEEGFRGNPMGKKIDERDIQRKQSPAQIAWRIMYALKRRTEGHDRLRFVVNRFLGSTPGGNANGIADDILKAWLSVLVPLVYQDWEAWLSRRARSI